MAQLSRPFQIALAAFVLIAAVWFFALHGRSSSGSSSSSTPASSASASEKAGAPSPVYHGPAPGVSGLTRAVSKAHEAVATSQKNAKQLERKSDEASSASPPASSAGSSSAKAAGATAPGTASATHAAAGAAASTSAHKPASTAGVPPLQTAVEAELKQGRIVVLLFWNPKGADDQVTHSQLRLLVRLHSEAAKAKTAELRHADRFFGLELDKKIAVHEGRAKSVAAYGSITRGVQVDSTPTILIVNKQHKASTITGGVDAYAIEQAIEEARAG